MYIEKQSARIAERLRARIAKDELLRAALMEIRKIKDWPALHPNVFQAVARVTGETDLEKAYGRDAVTRGIVEYLIKIGALVMCEQPGYPLLPCVPSFFDDVLQADGGRAKTKGDPDAQDFFAQVCHTLRGHKEWPLSGREIAEMIRPCISAGNADFVGKETVRILRELRDKKILVETSFGTDLYRPGPNFRR